MTAGGNGIAATPGESSRWWFLRAAAPPLVGVGLAYALWWISDRLLYVGPLDRAQFGWLVVVPVWSLSPFAAAYAWRRLDESQRLMVASIVGSALAVVAAFLFWLASAIPDCQFGAVRSPAEWIVPPLIVGVVVGAGFAATCLATTAVLRGHRWAALLVGAASAFALVFAIVLVASSLLPLGTGICQPLPPG